MTVFVDSSSMTNVWRCSAGRRSLVPSKRTGMGAVWVGYLISLKHQLLGSTHCTPIPEEATPVQHGEPQDLTLHCVICDQTGHIQNPCFEIARRKEQSVRVGAEPRIKLLTRTKIYGCIRAMSASITQALATPSIDMEQGVNLKMTTYRFMAMVSVTKAHTGLDASKLNLTRNSKATIGSKAKDQQFKLANISISR